MKKGRYIIPLLLCLATTIQAQNPGFQGKKVVAGVGLGLGDFYRGSLKASPLFHLEASISAKNSLRLGFSTRNLSTTYEDYPIRLNDLTDYFGNNPDYRDLTISGDLTGEITGKVQSFQFGIRRYRNARGAIAPFGLFFDYALDFSMIQIEEATAQTKGRYLGKPLTLSLPYQKEYSKTQHISYQMGFGTKLFLENGHFLEYQASVSLNLTFRESSLYQNTNMDIARSVAIQEDSFRSLILINFIYGLGI